MKTRKTAKTTEQVHNVWKGLAKRYKDAARGSATRKRIEAKARREGVYIGESNV